MYLRYAAVCAMEDTVARDGVSSYAKSGRKFRIMTDGTRVVMHQVILLPSSTPNFVLVLCEMLRRSKGIRDLFLGDPPIIILITTRTLKFTYI